MKPDLPDRSYRITVGEQAGAGLRRAARGRADAALDRLHVNAQADAATAVHDARKDLKKLRSLLRLVRDDLGERRYRSQNRRYRAAARQLSPAREAEVNLETLTALIACYPAEALGAEALRDALEQERGRLATSGGALDERIARATADIAGGAAGIDDWPLDGDDFDLVRAGLDRAYKRGRRGLRTVRDDPSAEAVHAWRKRVKDLWYQLRLLQGAWPPVLKTAAKEAHELADLLGDHHDLSVLVEKARAQAPDDPDTDMLATLAEQRQAELLADALQLGDRLYAEKPSRFTRRIERYWRAWRQPPQ
ncbi:MAG TPA: CHAD domain-containing protein [Thermoleophilaceae bacterium]|nr:CHAD domain-containing protein [Thermoleophilaceae bacterium]